MERAKYLQDNNLKPWLAELSQTNTVFAPRWQGDVLLFVPFDPNKDMAIDGQATLSPKETLFPRSETLFDFTYRKDPDDLGKMLMENREILPEESVVVFGGRPCDARGFTMFDRVYLSGKIKDIYYQSRREKTILITLACEKPVSTCFCHWVGCGPADHTGSDVLATVVEGGFLLEAVSTKGEKLLDSSLLTDGTKWIGEAQELQKRALAMLGEVPDMATVPGKLMEIFDDLGFWERVSAKCLSCGACAYLCPSCYCFTISDEKVGLKGSRLRSWDNCMSAQFTMEASGHNPRPTKAHRMRNRVGHKFSYYPQVHNGHISCCGCGRCIKSCPVGMDIREIVLQAVNHAPVVCEE